MNAIYVMYWYYFQYDLVTRISNEEGRAFEELAKVCADGHWIYTSSMTGLNVERAVNIMIELVCIYTYVGYIN